MRLQFSPIRPITSTEPRISPWDSLGGVVGTPPPPALPNHPVEHPETVLSQETLRSTLIGIGAAASPTNMAIAEAMAKLGVPLTEMNMLEGQTILARLPDVNPAVFALTKALDLPPTPAVMRALNAVVDQKLLTNRLDLDTLDLLTLLPQPNEDSAELSSYLTKLFQKIGQSTENKLLTDPTNANLLPVYDTRSALLNLATSDLGGLTSAAADRHASFIEGQQILNQVSVTKLDNSAPLYFSFPIKLAEREAGCEVTVWAAKEQRGKDASSADREEYLKAIVRVTAERIGIVETSLVGMWSGRLICSLFAEKPATCRLLKRDISALSRALASIGWSVDPIEVLRREQFPSLWLGGDLLDGHRLRVDERI